MTGPRPGPGIINVARYQQRVRAMFGIDGENAVPTIAELQPVVLVEGERDDLALAAGENLRVQGAVVAAGGAGNSSVITLLNPAGSGVVVIIEAIDTFGATGFSTLPQATVLGTFVQAGASLPRDTRGTGGAAGQIWTRNTAVPLAEIGRIHTVGLNKVFFAIAPGGPPYAFWNVTVNAIAEITLFWRERALEGPVVG